MGNVSHLGSILVYSRWHNLYLTWEEFSVYFSTFANRDALHQDKMSSFNFYMIT